MSPLDRAPDLVPPVRPTYLFVSAGEVSGDRYAADVVKELAAGGERWRFEGLGGPRLGAAGVRLRAGLEDLAVMGLAEVVRRLGWFRRLRGDIVEGWRRDPPDAVLLVDYPGLNLRLARDARRLGLRTLYYVTPTVWAWNERRVRTLRDAVDLCLVILPFEEPFLGERGVRARFVGHPLGRDTRTPRDREAFLRGLGLDPAVELLGLLPGSRHQELRALAPAFLEAGRRAAERRPGLGLAFGAATPALARELRTLVGGDVPIVVDRTADLIAASAALITKSGSVTVEAALIGTPMVVAYRMSPVTLWLARRLVKVDHIAMVNILRGRRAVPELLQAEARPAALADHVLRLLDSREAREAMGREFDAIRAELLGRDAPAEVAAAVRAALAAPRRSSSRLPRLPGGARKRGRAGASGGVAGGGPDA